MSGEAETVPDWQLERYRLHELPSDEQQAVAGAAERSEAIRARLAALDRSDREILALHPPRPMAEVVRARAGRVADPELSSPPRGRRFGRSLAGRSHPAGPVRARAGDDSGAAG
jgi:hypothetical protein